jgi:lycopene cyclase domain-containing protein
MKEYTLLSLVSVLVAIAIDRKTGVNVLKKREFYFFLLFILFWKFLVNGYLTGFKVVLYNPAFYMGIRLGTIPLEDFLFGFSMVVLSVVFWEYAKAAVKG